jgi:hypothetical protein
LSTLFWLIQNDPTAEPSLSVITNNKLHLSKTVSNFINVTQILNNTHSLKAFERSLADFSSSTSVTDQYQSRSDKFHCQDSRGCAYFCFAWCSFEKKV